MELMTISELSKSFHISTRTLRYYEQIGLIQSIKKDDYAYRTYDEATIARLQQILVLRKLRIPLKQIGLILQSENTAEIIEAFRQNLNEVDDEITALSTIRDIIGTFIERLNESIHQDIKLSMLDDTALLEAVDALTVSKSAPKEEKTAADLEKASTKLNKLTDRDVRIVYLPPSDVAAYQYEGDEPEDHVGRVIDNFVQDNGLHKIKPDLRHYGFNAPDPKDETNHHGYEMWVTIPEGFDVPAPLVKKRIEGGLYGAHMIMMGAFEEWHWLFDWVGNSEKYEFRDDTSKGANNMNGLLEEYLNYYSRAASSDPSALDAHSQLDLLIPIKEKKQKRRLWSGRKNKS